MKGTIKVIKREQRSMKEKPEPKAATSRETAREMVSTVSSWVNEFQQRRRTETSEAIKKLLIERVIPSGA